MPGDWLTWCGWPGARMAPLYLIVAAPLGALFLIHLCVWIGGGDR